MDRVFQEIIASLAHGNRKVSIYHDTWDLQKHTTTCRERGLETPFKISQFLGNRLQRNQVYE